MPQWSAEPWRCPGATAPTLRSAGRREGFGCDWSIVSCVSAVTRTTSWDPVSCHRLTALKTETVQPKPDPMHSVLFPGALLCSPLPVPPIPKPQFQPPGKAGPRAGLSSPACLWAGWLGAAGHCPTVILAPALLSRLRLPCPPCPSGSGPGLRICIPDGQRVRVGRRPGALGDGELPAHGNPASHVPLPL